MKSNINGIDRSIRVILAILLAGLFITGVVRGVAGIILLVIAIILAATATINFCPVWHFLGINTRKKKGGEGASCKNN